MSEVIQFKISEDLLEEIFQRPISKIDPRLIVQLVTKAISLYLEQEMGLDEHDVLIGYTTNFSISTN